MFGVVKMVETVGIVIIFVVMLFEVAGVVLEVVDVRLVLGVVDEFAWHRFCFKVRQFNKLSGKQMQAVEFFVDRITASPQVQLDGISEI